MSTDSTKSTDAATNVAEHEKKVQAGGDKLQAQSEQKLGEMAGNPDLTDDAKANAESKPKSAADDQPNDPDPS